jgi:hypothetical protein
VQSRVAIFAALLANDQTIDVRSDHFVAGASNKTIESFAPERFGSQRPGSIKILI